MEAVLRDAGEAMVRERKSRAEVLAVVGTMTGLTKEDIFRHTHERRAVHARAIYCYLCTRDAGSTGGELMRELEMSAGAISKLVAKGRLLLRDQN